MVLKPSLLKGVWSPEEDAVIFDCVARGISDWSEVASFLPKRKARYCRERWETHLDPALSSGIWSPEEETQLLGAVEAHGTNWNMVARHLSGRTELMVQQQWNAIVLRNAVNTGRGRRGRRKADAAAGNALKERARASSPPIEEGLLLVQEPSVKEEVGAGNGDSRGINTLGVSILGASDQMALTEREKALVDHAFKTGLSAATGGGSGGLSVPVDLGGTVAKGDGAEPVSFASEEEDIFAPLTAALLKDEDCGECTPTALEPPSPSVSPQKQLKQHPDYTALGDQLGDGWGVDEDPAMADLYRSLDNIGESLFNEDTFELSFDFDSVDKPAPSCDDTQMMPSKSWDNLEKEVSPFRQAAAKAAATMEPAESSSSQADAEEDDLQEACARAAAAAAAATVAAQAAAAAAAAAAAQISTETPAVKQAPAGGQQAPDVAQVMVAGQMLMMDQAPAVGQATARSPSPVAEIAQALASVQVPAPTPILAPSSRPPPRRDNSSEPVIRRGFLRWLLLSMNADTEKKQASHMPFSTVRGCLSEVNAPSPPSPSSAPTTRSSSPQVQSTSRVGRRPQGGENHAPRRGKPLVVALFTQVSRRSQRGNGDESLECPTLKHGKAEAKVPLPQPSGSGAPLSSLPTNGFN